MLSGAHFSSGVRAKEKKRVIFSRPYGEVDSGIGDRGCQNSSFAVFRNSEPPAWSHWLPHLLLKTQENRRAPIQGSTTTLAFIYS
ncbi:hypothetical protein CC2G_014887 [Coprinopsis cinerea AmutBmut pab1-1]|nr:hypothetical protein CC2G_014887 [Coprinopsis cinerea AmutBmut pab1-1]